jgi:hypothetical protein
LPPPRVARPGALAGADPAGSFWSVCEASAWETATFAVSEDHLGKGCKANLLRCLFGNPFRPVALKPAWLTADVLNLTRAAYEERLMPQGELDSARLYVLADGLEESGCTSAEVLGYQCMGRR